MPLVREEPLVTIVIHDFEVTPDVARHIHQYQYFQPYKTGKTILLFNLQKCKSC